LSQVGEIDLFDSRDMEKLPAVIVPSVVTSRMLVPAPPPTVVARVRLAVVAPPTASFARRQ
jgi:hypothetical protein